MVNELDFVGFKKGDRAGQLGILVETPSEFFMIFGEVGKLIVNWYANEFSDTFDFDHWIDENEFFILPRTDFSARELTWISKISTEMHAFSGLPARCLANNFNAAQREEREVARRRLVLANSSRQLPPAHAI